MSSWIYVFSKFTPEALLFEALIIFTLSVGYTAFWVLHKRRLGAIHAEVPAGVVKGYLSQLILDAEQLRLQLFGLLAAAGIQMPPPLAQQPLAQSVPPPVSAAAVLSGDPEALKKLAMLEGKMAEQSKAMEAILADKARMEKELVDARAKGGGGASPEVPKLQEKIQTLESKLAEYSVIEDDLANLKRLQQENTQLKAALGKSGPASASGGPASVKAASAVAPAMAPATAPAQPSEPAAETAAPATSAEPNFEGLVDQVEASLMNADAPAEAVDFAPASAGGDPLSGLEALGMEDMGGAMGSSGSPLDELAAPDAATAPPPQAPQPPATASSGQKSDEDLVAEFEKMLNS